MKGITLRTIPFYLTGLLAVATLAIASTILNKKPTQSLDAQLLEAIANNNPQEVAQLVRDGAQVNQRLEQNRTPLMQASFCGFKQELIPQTMPPCCHGHEHEDDSLWKPAYEKLLADRREIIGLLIEAGAEINAQDDEGNTALHSACIMNNDPKKVALLLSAGADSTIINNNGHTALMEAEYDGSEEAARYLSSSIL